MIGEVLGSYRILSMIGQGGMGVVYRAEHTLLGRMAAVKRLRPEMSREQIDRFFNEARAAAMIRHPGLVEVFDFGHHTDGSAYIVMELLEGESLADRLARDTKLEIPAAAAIARQVASALHVAHEQGIVHRDLKPENLFLVPDTDAPRGQRAKVLDFGIAKLTLDQTPRSVKTNTGAIFGTPRYMSPEQCKNARTVDRRSDIYALGCILYEMLLGVAPFDYDNWGELIAAHIHETPPRPTELDSLLPLDVEALLLRALAKHVADRYQSMAELAQAIEAVWRTHSDDRVPSTPAAGVPVLQPLRTRATPALGVNVTPSSPSSRGAVGLAGSDPTMPAGSVIDMPALPALTVPAHVAPRRRPLLAIGASLLVVAAAGTIGVLMLTKRDHAPTETAFIVVDQRDQPEAGGAAVPAPILDPVDVAPTPSHDAGNAIVPLDAGKRAPVQPPPVPTEVDTRQLTRAFGRQTSAIAACFRKHPGDGADGISIRFQIDVAGKVTAAEVLPAARGATPLGTCLASVARATAFGPQPKTVMFRVPIHTNVNAP